MEDEEDEPIGAPMAPEASCAKAAPAREAAKRPAAAAI